MLGTSIRLIPSDIHNCDSPLCRFIDPTSDGTIFIVLYYLSPSVLSSRCLYSFVDLSQDLEDVWTQHPTPTYYIDSMYIPLNQVHLEDL